MSPGHYAMDADDMLARVDENTIMVVPTFGVTYTGAYELVKPLADALDDAPGRHRPRHRHPRRRGQRRLPRPVLRARHRVGLPAAAGQVDQHVGPQVRAGPARRRLGRLARRRRAARRPHLPRVLPRRRHAGVPDQLLPARPARSSPSTTTSSGSAARATAASTWRPTTPGRFLAEEIVKLGPFELICDSDPQTGIPAVAWKLVDGADPGYTLYDLADRLRIRGWQVPAYPLTGDGVRRRRAAHPRPPGRQPRPRVDPARRHARRRRPLHQAPGHGVR